MSAFNRNPEESVPGERAAGLGYWSALNRANHSLDVTKELRENWTLGQVARHLNRMSRVKGVAPVDRAALIVAADAVRRLGTITEDIKGWS